MIVNTGRAIVRRLAWRGPPSSTDRVAQLSYNPLRVITTAYTGYTLPNGQTWSFSGSNVTMGRRSFATKPASRPKAHTGRTTSKPRKKATTTTKPAASKTSSSKTSSTVKAKPGPKPGSKNTKPKSLRKARTTAKAKPKTRAKSKAKPKVRVKKVLTAEQVAKASSKKERARITELKGQSLTPPKLLPATAYLVVNAELAKASHGIKSKEAAAKYKSFTPEELEHYNHLANTNAAANKTAYNKWILSHTPDQILVANKARKTLKRLTKKTNAFPPLHDERLVKGPVSSYMRFNNERMNSGDYKLMKLRERSVLIAKEWKELGANEKKKYVDGYAQDRARYEQECKTVYNRELHPTAAAAA